MQKVRHLFWDFDGTLYDSYPQVMHAVRRALEELCPGHGITEEENMRDLKVNVGFCIQQCASRLGLNADVLRERYRFYHGQEKDFPPYAGLPECLRTLKEAGFCHYLYTHRNLSAVEQLKSNGLWELFTDGVTSEDGFPLKPAPDALLCMMERNHLTPDVCAMVGDRSIDLGAGKNAGMKGILFDPERYYQDYETDLYVYSMQELCEKLTQ